MKAVLSLVVLATVATSAAAEDPRVKWLAGDKAHTQYVFAGVCEKGKIWVATDDNPGGYDIMDEEKRTDDYILLKSRKYKDFTITIAATQAVHRQPGKPEETIKGGWRR